MGLGRNKDGPHSNNTAISIKSKYKATVSYGVWMTNTPHRPHGHNWGGVDAEHLYGPYIVVLCPCCQLNINQNCLHMPSCWALCTHRHTHTHRMEAIKYNCCCFAALTENLRYQGIGMFRWNSHAHRRIHPVERAHTLTHIQQWRELAS